MENEDIQNPEDTGDNELWDQVQKDRSATQAGDDPDAGAIAEAALSGETVEDDPFAGLPEPTRKFMESLQAKITETDTRFESVSQQLARANGTIGNLKQRLDESQRKFTDLKPTIEAVEADQQAKEKARIADQARRRTELREKISEFPDIAEYLDLVAPADVQPAEVKPEVKPEAQQETRQVTEDERRVLVLQRELSDVVPGWMKTRDSEEFRAWLPKQGNDIKAAADSWDVGQAASVFHAFAKHKDDAAAVAKVEQERAARLRRGEAVQGKGTTGSGDAGLDDWDRVARDRAREKARAA